MTNLRQSETRVGGRHAPGTDPYGRMAFVALLLVAVFTAGAGLVAYEWYKATGWAAASEADDAGRADRDLDRAARAAEQPAIPDSLLSPDATVPQSGPGTLTYGAATGPVLGTTGALRRFQVATEDKVGQDAEAFGTAVETILGDQRSWIAGKNLRLQRVGKTTVPDFTVILATPKTSEKMCAAAGLQTRGYTSCRVSGKVIINLARWLTATPTFGAPVDVYRSYAINHEVGHELGHGHEDCPKRGKAAPVMLQQTLGLRGCVANAWPYLNGRRYSGPSIA